MDAPRSEVSDDSIMCYAHESTSEGYGVLPQALVTVAFSPAGEVVACRAQTGIILTSQQPTGAIWLLGFGCYVFQLYQ